MDDGTLESVDLSFWIVAFRLRRSDKVSSSARSSHGSHPSSTISPQRLQKVGAMPNSISISSLSLHRNDDLPMGEKFLQIKGVLLLEISQLAQSL